MSGFNDWNKALVKDRGFQKHTMSQDHQSANIAYNTFMKGKPVNCQLSDEADKQRTQREITIKKNRNIIGRLFDVSRLFGKLGMPFRGHDESADSSNRGVYLEFLDFLAASGDSILNEHFQTAASNATYLSPTIQNEMIEIVGHSIRDVVITDIKSAGIFSILMDETTDASHQEQVSIMARFVNSETSDVNSVVVERLVAVVVADATTGEALTNLLLGVLDNVGLKLEDIVGQGYDGGANMRGGAKGVQARIKSLNPRALYTHCYAHCLNRALVNAVCSREYASARDFFGVVELIYSFVQGSAARHQFFIEAQEQFLTSAEADEK